MLYQSASVLASKPNTLVLMKETFFKFSKQVIDSKMYKMAYYLNTISVRTNISAKNKKINLFEVLYAHDFKLYQFRRTPSNTKEETTTFSIK